MIGSSLANGQGTSKRRELDFYPTPENVTVALMDFLNLPKTKVWECACGDGAMSEVLTRYGHDVFSSDLRHTTYGVGGLDFLQTPRPQDVQALITNPPFNLSEAFIRKACSEVEIVAMVLKSQYWHAAKRQRLFEELPPTWVLPLSWRPDFLAGERGGAPTMEVLWTVWVRGQTDTRYRVLKKPK